MLPQMHVVEEDGQRIAFLKKTSHEFSFSKLYWPASCAQDCDVVVIQSAMGCGQFSFTLG
jgi:hypothetical protein